MVSKIVTYKAKPMRVELVQDVVSIDAMLKIRNVGPAIPEPFIVGVRRTIRVQQEQGQQFFWMVKLNRQKRWGFVSILRHIYSTTPNFW